jgi:hypothetical protein
MPYLRPSIHSVSACDPRPSAASIAALYPRIACSLDMAPLSRSARKPATASAKRPMSTQMTSRARASRRASSGRRRRSSRLLRPPKGAGQRHAGGSVRGWPVNPAGRDAVRPLGARRPHAEGRHLGDPGGATLCGSVTPQALRASYHGNVASIPSKVRCQPKRGTFFR